MIRRLRRPVVAVAALVGFALGGSSAAGAATTSSARTTSATVATSTHAADARFLAHDASVDEHTATIVTGVAAATGPAPIRKPVVRRLVSLAPYPQEWSAGSATRNGRPSVHVG
jgi:hypothetical protein